MSTLNEREAYKNNPYFKGHIYGNFSPFYVAISICSVFLFSLIVLNIILGCCSKKYRGYWQDRHTGNRWLVSIWSATPHLQPPLDLTELKDVTQLQHLQPKPRIFSSEEEEDIEAQVPVHYPQPQRPQRPESRGRQQHHRQKEEYVELHKRESDI